MRNLVLLAAILGLLAVGCHSARDAVSSESDVGGLIHFDSVAAALEFNPLLSTLKKALRATNLDEVLNEPRLVATVVAPTNQGFTRLLKKLQMTEQELLDDTHLLSKVLKYHVIPGAAIKSSGLNDGEREETLLRKQYLTFHKELYYYFLTKITVQGGDCQSRATTVILPDVEAAQVVIHIINDVLLPHCKLPKQEQL